MKPCPYCAQTETKKDGHGYCKKHDCLGRSGLRAKLEDLCRRAGNLILITGWGQVGRVVSNPYSKRNRAANDLMYEAKKLFGYVPSELLAGIDSKDQLPWDRNVRW